LPGSMSRIVVPAVVCSAAGRGRLTPTVHPRPTSVRPVVTGELFGLQFRRA
jgi:hypothetical protein